MNSLTLGLDLGTNSLGWALIDESGDTPSIRAAGSRVFPAGKSSVEDRRDKRSQRRTIFRRRQRHRRLLHALVGARLLPQEVLSKEGRRELHKSFEGKGTKNTGLSEDEKMRQRYLPYYLRAEALERQLDPYEFGRALAHLGWRRGFQANLKTDLVIDGDKPSPEDKSQESKEEKDARKKESKFKKAIENLKNNLKQGGLTLGQYFWDKLQKGEKIRGFDGCPERTNRAMYEEELRQICEQQKKYFPEIKPEQWTEIRVHILGQRDLQSCDHLIGACSLEPEQKRAPRASLWAQQFTLWETLARLKHYDRDEGAGEGGARAVPLSPERRVKLEGALLSKESGSLGWREVRKVLGHDASRAYNLADERRRQLPGSRFLSRLRAALGEQRWDELWGGDRKHLGALIWTLRTASTPEKLHRTLARKYGIEDKGVRNKLLLLASKSQCPTGYLQYSACAIRKLLPHLQAGKDLHEAREATGYSEEEVAAKRHEGRDPWDTLGLENISNHTVCRSLAQARKVLRAIWREYRQDIQTVRIELARDLKRSEKERKKMDIEQGKREKDNKEIAKILEEYGAGGFSADKREKYQLWAESIDPCDHKGLREKDGKTKKGKALSSKKRQDAILKHKLWRELRGVCVYSGKSIGLHDLFHGDVEVDHILPRHSLDNSYMNKTLAYRNENQRKGKNTPYSAFSGDKKKWEKILQIIKRLPKAKQERFKMRNEDITPEGCAERAMTDTHYICKEFAGFCARIMGVPQSSGRVQVSYGSLTGPLRSAWRWNRFLHPEDADKSVKHRKNRHDHRHHALDAVVIALSSPKMLERISRHHATEEEAPEERDRDAGWKFWSMLRWAKPRGFDEQRLRQQLEEMTVSHAPRRKVSGRLHRDISHGVTGEIDEETGNSILTRRVAIEKLTVSQVEKGRIRDKALREAIRQELGLEEGDTSEKKKKKLGEFQKSVKKDGFIPIKKDGSLGTPVKTIVIKKSFDKSSVYDFRGEGRKIFETKNNHHMEILQHRSKKNRDGSAKKAGIVVSRLEAARRVRGQEPVVQREGPWVDDKGKRYEPDEWELLMSLCVNDMVAVETDEGEKIYRVQNMTAATIAMRLHTASTLKNKDERLFASPGTFQGRKITVDPLGRICSAGD